MNLFCKQLNPHACRSYLVGREGSTDVILIDPVLEHLEEYRRLIEKEELKLLQVVDTHTHADHISGAAAIKDVTDCLYMMHEDAPARCANFRVHDGFEWDCLGVPVRVLHTPGHTRDSICLMFPEWIFTGDTLFLDDGGAGRDDLPGGDPGLHWESLKRLGGLPDDLIVYPAHDYRGREPSSLGRQKHNNPHLKPRTREEFVRYLEDLRLGPADWMKDVLKANYACARDPKAAWIPVDTPACEVKGTLDVGVNEVEVVAITVSGLREKLASEQPPLLLDVRESYELSGELGHIEGILHIPIGSLAHQLDELEAAAAGKHREIVTVCRSGARAFTAAQILGQAGFAKVQVLEGGMISWNTY
ncbi:MAG: MBL fold metallo-hydrolase [Spirochaetaceae bacterium]|nr:MAG: MBL fold metallo-hydrolase [Spirochaetaceae bacterium]